MRLKDRIRAFMVKHDIKHEEMALKLNTPYGTFQKWMRSGEDSTQPPACMVTLMSILERSAEARRLTGMQEPKK